MAGGRRGQAGLGLGLGLGPGGTCRCPKCKKEFPHQLGSPCVMTLCPDCNVRMIRVIG